MTTTANSHAATASMAVGDVVGPSVLALLCPQSELAAFGTWDIRARLTIVAILLVLPLLLGIVAWTLMRRTFHRFDEWVGRPHRGDEKSLMTGLKTQGYTCPFTPTLPRRGEGDHLLLAHVLGKGPALLPVAPTGRGCPKGG